MQREAQIIAQAGLPGAVTIATSVAGRGTDIVLGGNPKGLVLQVLMKLFAHHFLSGICRGTFTSAGHLFQCTDMHCAVLCCAVLCCDATANNSVAGLQLLLSVVAVDCITLHAVMVYYIVAHCFVIVCHSI